MEGRSHAEIAFRESFRYMLLPIAASEEETALSAVKKKLLLGGVLQEEFAEFIRLKYKLWQETAELDVILKSSIHAAIASAGGSYSEILSDQYFDLHIQFQKEPLFDFERATMLLSHSLFVASMAKEKRMSATKIEKLIKAVDGRLDFISWKDIFTILTKLKLAPELNSESIKKIFEQDKTFSAQVFADSTMEEASYQVGEVARQLRCSADVEMLLNNLCAPDSMHVPYLQMLHFQCMIAGLYDHVLSSLYEFNPRGNVANELFAYWNEVVNTSNPFLNNAKAVTALDSNWAISRKGREFKAANMLVRLLTALDTMGFSAVQELAAWIRRWLMRFITLKQTQVVPVPEVVSTETQVAVLASLAEKPTNTYGILEQRFVDVLAAVLHPETDGWRSRGLGDAVNSNNLSKKKLGDCDFQDATSKRIVSYEAHGGKLTKLYVEGHIRTLARSLTARAEELRMIADPSEWDLTVCFVSYTYDLDLPDHVRIGQFDVRIMYITFKQLLETAVETNVGINQVFSSYFIAVINNRRTPSVVREKILALPNLK